MLKVVASIFSDKHKHLTQLIHNKHYVNIHTININEKYKLTKYNS